MLDSDIRVALYLFLPELNKIAKDHSNPIKAHFRGNKLVHSIVELASKGMTDPSIDELSARLRLMDLNSHNCDIILNSYKELDRSPTVIEDVRQHYRNCVSNILITEASKLSNTDAYLAELARIRALDFGQKDEIDSSVTRMKFKDLDVDKIKDSIKGTVPSIWEPFNKSNAYGGYRLEQLIMVCGGPGSGKSMFMMQEMVKNLKLGRRCIYCAIGDLIAEDFITRPAAYLFKVPLSDIILDLDYFKSRLAKEIPNIDELLDVLFIKPGRLNANQLKEYLAKKCMTNQPTTVFIDYDSNLQGEDSLYAKGGEIYSVAEDIASQPGNLVFIASQPKMFAYELERFGMTGIGESGRKNHISAIIITIGKNPISVNPVGYITIAKQRRGLVFSAPYFRDVNGEFVFINENTRTKLVMAPDRRTIVTTTSEAIKMEINDTTI